MELLEIYDEAGKKIGMKPREQIHRDGDWHRVVHCWITDFSGEEKWVYFQQRSFGKRDFPGLYDISSAGHIDPGETPEQAAVRELWEETGLRIEQENLCEVGMIKEVICLNGLDDREISHIFWHDCRHPAFCPGEEVERMVRTTPQKMRQWVGGGNLEITCDGKRWEIVHREQTCSHDAEYLNQLLDRWGV